MEAAVGEASLTNLASLIMMIADANGTKELGGDIYWKVLVDEMCTFERGDGDLFIVNPSSGLLLLLFVL